MNHHRQTGLELRAVSKAFGARAALRAVELAAQPGEIVGITGPSGAGKTTIGRIVAGIEHADSGEVRLGGHAIDDLPPQARDVALMFESYALYPQMTVRENLLFPLKSPRYSGRAADSETRAREFLELVEMTSLAGRYPGELSGGQRQRVALCRTLIQDPAIYLLDEPISHLDAKLRYKLRGEIRRRLVARAVPTLWFTPDAMEALAVGDRVAVLIDGVLQQIGTPAEIYTLPANTAVARLIGDPPMNLLRGKLSQQNGALWFRHPDLSVALTDGARRAVENAAVSGEIVLGVRPAHVGFDPRSDAGAEVYAVEPFGKYSIITLTLGDGRFRIKTTKATCRAGERLDLHVQSDCLVMFDPASGRALVGPQTALPVPSQEKPRQSRQDRRVE